MSYRIFISHKDEDYETAKAVKDAITRFTGELDCFIARDSIQAGEDWRERLREELRNTDLLLLLFTAPSANWDWCLYEAGLYTRLVEPGERKVVCIHEGPEPPSPLLHLQAIEAEPSSVVGFLERLLRTTEVTGRERPLNENVSDELLAEAANEICDGFGVTVKPYYNSYRLLLEESRRPAGDDELDGIPDEWNVTGTDSSLRIFGRTRGATWAEVVGRHREQDEPWLGEIDEAFVRACDGEATHPITHTFTGGRGTHSIFRPELYRVDFRGDRPVGAVLVFTEEIAPAKVGGPLFNRLRVSERFHHEVFARVGDRLPSDETLKDLESSFTGIEEEAEAHGVFSDAQLERLFPDGGQLELLQSIRADWRSARQRMKEAIEYAAVDDAVVALRELDALNDRYRSQVARRYAEALDDGD